MKKYIYAGLVALMGLPTSYRLVTGLRTDVYTECTKNRGCHHFNKHVDPLHFWLWVGIDTGLLVLVVVLAIWRYRWQAKQERTAVKEKSHN